jgi:DNA-binding transcriptional LysR family regulator
MRDELLRIERELGSCWLLSRLAGQSKLSSRTREDFPVRCDDQMLYWNLLLTGVGVGFAQTLVARRYHELEQVEIGLHLPPMPVWLVMHEEVRTNARIRRGADFLALALGDILRNA